MKVAPETLAPETPTPITEEERQLLVQQTLENLEGKFALSGLPFIGIVDEIKARDHTHWTHGHTGGGVPQSSVFFFNGKRYENYQKSIRCLRRVLKDDDTQFGPLIAAAGCTIFIVPDTEEEVAYTHVLLDRNHTEGSVVEINGEETATGQHLIGDLTLKVHMDTFLECPQQLAEKTAERFAKQALCLQNIEENYTRLGELFGCGDWFWKLYQEHTADGTAGELLAAAVTSETGKIVYLSNKLACCADDTRVITVPGGKPKWTVRVTDHGTVAEVQSLVAAACDETLEESGLDARALLAVTKSEGMCLLAIGEDDAEPIRTPHPLNAYTAAVGTLVY